MQSEKFAMNHGCDCHSRNVCSCVRNDSAHSIFEDNVADVADALADVMAICGIHECKTRAAKDVIGYAFQHYDEVRHRVDAVPRKRLSREDLIHDLGLKCLMTRMEAQLAYSLVKRAFKAFYHGTVDGGIRNPIIEAQLVHKQECLWVHAARRSAQIFAAYEGMFPSVEQNYAAQIRCVYKRLYDKLCARIDLVQLEECVCRDCLKKAVYYSRESMRSSPATPQEEPGKQTSSDVTSAYGEEVLVLDGCKEPAPLSCDYVLPRAASPQRAGEAQWRPQRDSGIQLSLPMCAQCRCPRLVCDCDVRAGAPSLECSQGPYVCRWLLFTPEDETPPPDPCLTAASTNHECPVDCDETTLTTELSCVAECECDCGPSCECTAEDNSLDDDDDSQDDALFALKGEEEEDLDAYTCDEPTSYAGCCAMLSYIAEEMRLQEQPTALAQVAGVRVEQHGKAPAQSVLVKAAAKPVVVKAAAKPVVVKTVAKPVAVKAAADNGMSDAASEAANRQKAEEFSKLLADIF